MRFPRSAARTCCGFEVHWAVDVPRGDLFRGFNYLVVSEFRVYIASRSEDISTQCVNGGGRSDTPDKREVNGGSSSTNIKA